MIISILGGLDCSLTDEFWGTYIIDSGQINHIDSSEMGIPLTMRALLGLRSQADNVFCLLRATIRLAKPTTINTIEPYISTVCHTLITTVFLKLKALTHNVQRLPPRKPPARTMPTPAL